MSSSLGAQKKIGICVVLPKFVSFHHVWPAGGKPQGCPRSQRFGITQVVQPALTVLGLWGSRCASNANPKT